MALSDLLSNVDAFNGSVAVVSLLLGLSVLYLYRWPSVSLPEGSPPLIKEDWPIIGTLRFFTARWDFFRETMAHSSSSSFSFHVGQKHVIGVFGEDARKAYFESKELDFSDGYVIEDKEEEN